MYIHIHTDDSGINGVIHDDNDNTYVIDSENNISCASLYIYIYFYY